MLLYSLVLFCATAVIVCAIPNFLYPNYTKIDGCELPTKPDHGFYVVENCERPLVIGDLVAPNTVLNYFCEDNYIPSQNLSVCTQNKSWSPNVTCRKNCEMMTSDSVNFVCLTSSNKRVACDRIMPHGSSVHPFCRQGYSPLGELDTVRCRDGKWDKRIPKCIQMLAQQSTVNIHPQVIQINPSKRRGCPLPPFPDNGEYQIKDPKQKLGTGSLVQSGTTLIYFCEESYELSADKAVCLRTGRWSANPVCHLRTQAPPCNLPPFPKNGTYYIQYSNQRPSVGEPVAFITLLLYTCDEGFALSTNISRCMGGTWSMDPQCVPVVDTNCTLPPRPEYGTYQISPPGMFNRTPGQFVSQFTVLEYSCDFGYEPTKRVTICLQGKGWSDLPGCRPIPNILYPNDTKIDGCELPTKPDHGFYVVENYERPLVIGDLVAPYTVLNYICDDNYIPSQNLSVCTQNKSWSPNVTCRKNCEMMTSDSVNFVCLTSSNKRVACDRIMPHGSSVHPFCRQGYSPLGELVTVRCRDGKWDKRMPECTQMLEGGKPTTSWYFGIFQETGRNVLPMCVFTEGQLTIRVPELSQNQQRLPANYYTFEGGKFFKLPNNQLKQDLFDSAPVDTIQGVAQPGNGNKPKIQIKPVTTTLNEIFPWLSSNDSESVWQQQVPNKCRQVCDDNQIFGDFVASTLRNFKSDQDKMELKLRFQEIILETTKKLISLSADTTSSPGTLMEWNCCK